MIDILRNPTEKMRLKTGKRTQAGEKPVPPPGGPGTYRKASELAEKTLFNANRQRKERKKTNSRQMMTHFDAFSGIESFGAGL